MSALAGKKCLFQKGVFLDLEECFEAGFVLSDGRSGWSGVFVCAQRGSRIAAMPQQVVGLFQLVSQGFGAQLQGHGGGQDVHHHQVQQPR